LSVQAASKNFTTEIIVIDNNSSDGSCQMIKQRFPNVSLIENSLNVGFAKANNQGVSIASGEYLLILNPDTYLAEDTIKNVFDFVSNKNDVGAIGVKLIDGIGNFLPESKRNIPTIKVAALKIAGNSKSYYANHIDENEISEVDILTGAFLLIKRKVYEVVGGFDEDYFMYGEDIDFSYKLLRHGLQNYYLGNTSIIHYKGESTVKDISYLKHFYGAMRVFYNKHFRVNLFYYIILYAGVKMLILFKSIFSSIDIKEIKKGGNIIYVGKDREIYKKLVLQIKPTISKITDQIEDINGDYETVFFDNTFISNKEIIKLIQEVQLKNISKRIIPRNTNFYIGSDSSANRGEAIQF
jgi:GT2 family glycosyltransferase